MHTPSHRLLIAVLAAVVGLAATTAHAAVRIDSINPTAAKPGDQVTITGGGFGAQNVRITVGELSAKVMKATGNTATFVVPSVAPGPTTVRATNPGGQSATIGLQLLGSVVLDSPAAVQAVVGPAGGVLRTTSQNVQFALTIPEAALDADTVITITPIRAMADLPFSGGMLAAVRFAPAGLRFLRPATLTLANVPAPPAAPPGAGQGILGFTRNESGSNLEVLPVTVAGGAVHLPIAHFSDAGIADARIADFVRMMQPLVDAFPANPSPQVAASLVNQLLVWIGEFGFDLCVPTPPSQTTLCKGIYDIASAALQSELQAALQRVVAHVAAREPFLAHQDLGTVVTLMLKLAEISDYATQLSLTGYDMAFDPSDLVDPFKSIVDLAKQQALADPRRSLLLLLLDIAADEARLDIDLGADGAIPAFVAVVEDLLSDATLMCRTQPLVGTALLDIVVGDVTTSSLRPALETYLPSGTWDRMVTERTACPIQVSPSPASVAMFEQVQLTGTAIGYTPDTLSWTIEGAPGGSTVDATTGVFTGGNVSGTYTVRAASVADPSRYRRIAVNVVPITVAVNPPSATLDVGQSLQFTATVAGSQNTAVRWSASGGTIDPNTGIFSSTTTGPFTVRATSVLDSSFFAEATVTVRRAVGLGVITDHYKFEGHCPGCEYEFWQVNLETKYVWNVTLATTASGALVASGNVTYRETRFAVVPTGNGLSVTQACEVNGSGTIADQGANRLAPFQFTMTASIDRAGNCDQGDLLPQQVSLSFEPGVDTLVYDGSRLAAIVWNRVDGYTDGTPAQGSSSLATVTGRIDR